MNTQLSIVKSPQEPAFVSPIETPRQWWDLQQPFSLRLYAGLRWVDFLVGPLLLALTLMAANAATMPGGVASFFALRITVKNLALLGLFSAVWYLVFAAFDLYDADRVRLIKTDLSAVFKSCSLASIPVLLFAATSASGAFDWKGAIAFWLAAMLFLPFARIAARVFGNIMANSEGGVRRCLVVGSGSRALKMYDWARMSSTRYEIIGVVDSTTGSEWAAPLRNKMIGSLADLRDILKNNVVDEVLVALPVKSCYGQIQETIQVCEEAGVECKLPSDAFSHSIGRPELERSGTGSFITLRMSAHDSRRIVKRTFDIVLSLLSLIALSPLLLVIAVLIRCSSRGPAIFSQTRYGANKRRFKMYKFRTMAQNAEQMQSKLETLNEMNGPVFKIRADPRITRIGAFLRRTSLDELPQLWNVLFGSMSIVGPRPLPLRDVSRFAEAWLMRRFSVKPGITCLWQISGRNDISFDHWMELDLRYIDHWSLGLDLEIFAKTFAVVARGKGAS